MKIKLAFAALSALVAAPSIAAPVLWISDSNANLVTVDVATGSATIIGHSQQALTDIAFDTSGNLYGISFTTLFRVDKTNGSLTTVGSLGLNGANALVFGSDNTLYAAASNTTSLYTVNTTTGQATSIGSTGFASSGDLAFVGGKLYLSADTSGADTLASIAFAPVAGAAVGSIGVDNVYGMARAENGVLYGVAGNSIYSLNTATGAATLQTTYNYAGRGLAYGTSFFQEAVIDPSVPEPATWALMIGGFGMVGASMRRRSVKLTFT